MLTVDGVATRDVQFLFISLTPRWQHSGGNGSEQRQPGISGSKICLSHELVLGRLCKEPHFARRDHIREIVESVSSPYVAGSFTADDDHALELPFPRLTARAAHLDLVLCSTPRLNDRTNERQLHTVPRPRCLADSDCRTADPAKALKLRARNASPFTVRPCPPPAKVDTRPPCGWTSRCVFWPTSPPCHHVTPWGPDAARAHQLQLVLFPSEPLRA